MSRWREYARQDRSRHQATINALDAVSRRRALTDEESIALERAIKRERLSEWRETGSRYWGPSEDQLALKLRAEGKHYSEIAPKVRRSPDAVAARLRYIRNLAR